MKKRHKNDTWSYIHNRITTACQTDRDSFCFREMWLMYSPSNRNGDKTTKKRKKKGKRNKSRDKSDEEIGRKEGDTTTIVMWSGVWFPFKLRCVALLCKMVILQKHCSVRRYTLYANTESTAILICIFLPSLGVLFLLFSFFPSFPSFKMK